MLDPITVSIAFLQLIWLHSKLVTSSSLGPNLITGVRFLNEKVQKLNWQDYEVSAHVFLSCIGLIYYKSWSENINYQTKWCEFKSLEIGNGFMF